MDASMKDIIALSKRRGFIFQSSEIYGGLNGFWDYGPLGVELKRNLKNAWWQDMVTSHNELVSSGGAPEPFAMTGIDSSIIMHPQVWRVSGHFDLFADQMVDCTESKKRYRFDQLRGRWVEAKGRRIFVATNAEADDEAEDTLRHALKYFNIRASHAEELKWDGGFQSLGEAGDPANVLAPDATQLGTLTEPREFNLMFKTFVGAAAAEDNAAFLRPETAQGIFVNFKNVVNSLRIRTPFGIAQIGKSFRNEITPRNYTFRSREFEQMEIEFFCHPGSSEGWYRYWRDRRMQWYRDLGLSAERLRLREHSKEELSHYSSGTADIEYAFPFLPAGEFGELEGVAHRGDFDLRSHMEGKLAPGSNPLRLDLDADGKAKYRGSGKDLTYRDDLTGERYTPHVIEPSAGADRATLAFLCDAFHQDQAPDEGGKMEPRIVLRLHPRLAPVKAAILPLVKKGGMPEIARPLYAQLKKRWNVFYDEKDSIGRRYRRQDEIGTPCCITIDSDTLQNGTVTMRDRDSLQQKRVPVAACEEEIQRLFDVKERH
jgi:glycyl-tRNA synthetase